MEAFWIRKEKLTQNAPHVQASYAGAITHAERKSVMPSNLPLMPRDL